MIPIQITRITLARIAALLGLAASAALPAGAAQADNSVSQADVRRVPLCASEAGAQARHARLCRALNAWISSAQISGPIARVDIRTLRADRAFWQTLHTADRELLRSLDHIEIARTASGPSPVNTLQFAAPAVHPDSQVAASVN